MVVAIVRRFLQNVIAVIVAATALSSNAGQTSYYIYDESGHVIGEYDANGNPIQEHVYLGDRPVAVVQGGASGTVGYVSTDQLNTPRVVTDQNQAVLWSWNSDPFGNGNPTGSLTYNLRFPGQYYDAETGHIYNDNRDYNAGNGRYLESDPIGLRGGSNTYGYTMANPLGAADPLGLLTWSDNAPQIVTGFPASGYVEAFPGAAPSPISSNAGAFTVGTWQIDSTCECDGSGGYKFTGFSVNFNAVIYIYTDYSCCQQTYDEIVRREFQHVSDINEWTQQARSMAQSLEEELEGRDYPSLADCEAETRAALNAALGASFSAELAQTAANFDYRGGPHTTPP